MFFRTSQEEAVDFSRLKVAELRKECTKRGLDSKGVKAVLVERLEEAAKSGGVEESSEDEDEEESDVSMEIDYSTMKVAELRAFCAKRDIDQKGTKAVLIKRLQDFNNADNSEEEEPEAEVAVDYASMKVAELRAELSEKGLDTKGVKAVLIKRLESA